MRTSGGTILLGWILLGGAIAPAPAAASPFWVFFRDRGPDPLPGTRLNCAPAAPAEERGFLGPERALEVARALPREAWACRARGQGRALPDEHDLPPLEPYVRRVAEYGRLRHVSRWLNAVSVDLDAADPARLEALRALPFVRTVRPVAVARPTSVGPSWDEAGNPLEVVLEPQVRSIQGAAGGARAPAGFEYGLLDYGSCLGQLTEIGVPALHALGYSGNRVRAMMIDTGFRKDHEAFARSELVAEWDFIFEDGNVQNEAGDLEWQHNHGTATWAIAGGYAPGVLIGPAYGAPFWLAKTEDVGSETRAEEDNYVAALEWAELSGVALTTASLSYVCFDDEFCYEIEDKNGDTAVISIAIDIAAAHGILCINSQGNYGCAPVSLGTPADADSVIAVGAVDSLNQIASFSACGPTYDGRLKPEVVARGVLARTASATEVNTYGWGSGTSFSGPLVAGAAALLLEVHPEWGPMEVRAALMNTADRAAEPDTQYGMGRIDAGLAAASAPILYPYAFSLAAPADSAATELYRPEFTWEASGDPDHGDPLLYTLWIQNGQAPGEQWSVEAGGDTTLILPFALPPDQAYRWWVTAEDLEGHRRFSREEFIFFFAPDPSGIADGATPPADEPDGGPGAAVRLRCAPNPFRESLSFAVSATTAGMEGIDSGSESSCSWAVYDPLGRRVAHGPLAREGAAWMGVWNGRARTGTLAAPGVYYLEARLGHRVLSETILRLPD